MAGYQVVDLRANKKVVNIDMGGKRILKLYPSQRLVFSRRQFVQEMHNTSVYHSPLYSQ